MTRSQFFRKWIVFLRKSGICVDVVFLSTALVIFFGFLPKEIFASEPATGGDMGSHFWPLVTLVKQGLPHFHVRVWNPGNLGGEPHLTHYFPGPYLLMALLSAVMPLGEAFNLGTVLPMAAFPICVYFCFHGLNLKFPIPILAAVASLSVLYNESFSMWGGNALSTLAGQFAHLYAVCFFLLAVGVLNWELNQKKFLVYSTFLWAAVLLCHFYIALEIPVVFLIFLFFHSAGDWRWRLRKLFSSGLATLALAAWFVLPMLQNSKWTTAFGLQWSSNQFYHEIFPILFWPFSLIALISLAAVLIPGSLASRAADRFAIVLFLSWILGSTFYFFVFPSWGLVDVRVIPIGQLAACLLAAVAVGLALKQFLPRPWAFFLLLPVIALGFWWPLRTVSNLPVWMKWNYSGWSTKPAFQDLSKLSQRIRGNFSDPRVIYENSELSNSAGTMRVFEMLPYFSGRATMESVYMQATVLAPAAFDLQAQISETPSCPFPNYACSTHHVPQSEAVFRLMGVSDLILISPAIQQEANQSKFLEKKQDFGLWHLYQLRQKPELIEVLFQPPQFLNDEQNFKVKFYEWFQHYQTDSPFLIVAQEKEQDFLRQASLSSTQQCHPEVKVEFDKIELTTDCPGRFHYLKFAYHPTWKASTEDPIFLVSPGFLGLIPTEKSVTLSWGHHWLWTVSDLLSWLTLAFLLSLLIVNRKNERKEQEQEQSQ